MKKMIALALSLMMLLCATAVLAEGAAEKTTLGTLKVGEAFTIQSKIPEGYTFSETLSGELYLGGDLKGGEGKPTVTVSIGYNEEYADVERFNDVDEETVQRIRDSFQVMDDVIFEDLQTAYGTRLLKVTQADRSFADIYTIYKGYELEFIMYYEDAEGAEITVEQIQMLVDFISDMDFVSAE